MDKADRKQVRWAIDYLDANRLPESADAVRRMLRRVAALQKQVEDTNSKMDAVIDRAYCDGFDDATTGRLT